MEDLAGCWRLQRTELREERNLRLNLRNIAYLNRSNSNTSFSCNSFRRKVDILYVHHSREFSMVIDYPKSYKPELNRNPGCAV